MVSQGPGLDGMLLADLDESNGARRNWRHVGFVTSVWSMVAVLVLLSPAMLVVIGWFTEGYEDAVGAGVASHRLHEVMFGALFTVALVGALSQLRAPQLNTAGFCQLTLTVAALTFFVTWTIGWDAGLLIYLLPLVALAALRRHRGTWAIGRLWWAALGPGLILLPTQIDGIADHAQRAFTEAQNHTSHWSAVAAFQAVLIGLAVITFLRLPGYRLTAVTLAGAFGWYGVAALIFPFDASSHRTSYSVLLIIVALAWVSLVGLDVRRRSRPSGRRMVLAQASVAFPIALMALVSPSLDTPPNVPHRLHPDQPGLTVLDVDRATCLSCHSVGTKGAPIPSHDLSEQCGDHCWGGRPDCVGCHQVDPKLGGPDIQLRGTDPVQFLSMTSHFEPLGEPALIRARRLAAGP
jgi:nitrate reductase cytochrome c-type subunit